MQPRRHRSVPAPLLNTAPAHHQVPLCCAAACFASAACLGTPHLDHPRAHVRHVCSLAAPEAAQSPSSKAKPKPTARYPSAQLSSCLGLRTCLHSTFCDARTRVSPCMLCSLATTKSAQPPTPFSCSFTSSSRYTAAVHSHRVQHLPNRH